MPASDYTPTVEQVAARLRSRTTTAGGAEAGTFNSNTRPTASQVEDVIAMAVNDIAGEVGTEIPGADADDADPVELVTSLTALYAAAQVELTFWPEQVATGESIYTQLMEQYNNRLPGVKKTVNRLRSAAGDTSSDMGEDGALPISTFPRNAGGLVGYDTQF